MEMPEKNSTQANELKSFEMLTFFVRDVFGTFFIEEGNWTFDEKNTIIGRTYFADRKRYKKAINDKTVENILQIYKMALLGASTYKPDWISQTIALMYKKHLGFNIDYLMFYDDDTEFLRKRKTQMIVHLTLMILQQVCGKESIPRSELQTVSCIMREKLLSFINVYSRGTYTEIVLRNVFDTDPGYEFIRELYGDIK